MPSKDPVVPVNGDMQYSWRILLFQTFAKAGPWALLSVLLLGVTWYEADKWLGAYIGAQDRYITQSSENILVLQRATQLLTETVTRNSDRMLEYGNSIRQLVTEMERANLMMQDGPQRAARTLAVLEQIEQHLRVDADRTKPEE